MARRSRTNAQEDDTELNMTPMLDVVFILLIFFIVTSVFVKTPGIEPDKPFAATDEEWDPTILVAVNSLDEVWIDDQPYDVDEIRHLIQSMKDENPKANAIIIGDREASAGVVWEIQDLMQEIGITARVSTD